VVQKQQAQSWSLLEQPDYQMAGMISPIKNGYPGDNLSGMKLPLIITRVQRPFAPQQNCFLEMHIERK
jgi:hypothetical protein